MLDAGYIGASDVVLDEVSRPVQVYPYVKRIALDDREELLNRRCFVLIIIAGPIFCAAQNCIDTVFWITGEVLSRVPRFLAAAKLPM